MSGDNGGGRKKGLLGDGRKEGKSEGHVGDNGSNGLGIEKRVVVFGGWRGKGELQERTKRVGLSIKEGEREGLRRRGRCRGQGEPLEDEE